MLTLIFKETLEAHKKLINKELTPVTGSIVAWFSHYYTLRLVENFIRYLRYKKDYLQDLTPEQKQGLELVVQELKEELNDLQRVQPPMILTPDDENPV